MTTFDEIDVAKLEVVRKLATGSSPETFALDDKRGRIYVSNEEGSSLSILDIDQNIIVHEVPTGRAGRCLYRRGLQDLSMSHQRSATSCT